MAAWDEDGIDPYSADLAGAMTSLPFQQKALEAKQRRAQMIMALAPDTQGMTVGPMHGYVAASPFAHLASAMAKIYGIKTARDAEQGYAPLAEQAGQAGAQQFRLQRSDKAREFGLRQREADLADMRAMAAESNAAAEAKAREAQLAESTRHNRAVEGLSRSSQEQDAWGYGQDASGGGVLYNKKTGQLVPLSPRGPGVQSPYPGKGHDLEKDVQSLGKDLESVGQMRSDLATLDSFVEKGDVPGFGPVAGRVPDLMASNEAISARQSAKRIMAAYIQMRSGTAASDREVERLLAANGLGPTATPEAIKQGVNSLRAMAAETVGRIEAKYHPDVVSTYKNRGGVSKDAFGGSKPKRVRVDAEGNVIP